MVKKIVGFFAGVLMALWAVSAAAGEGWTELTFPLQDGWAIRSSAEVRQGGAAIATAGYDSAGWLPTTVPSTVLAALIANKVYDDPYFGMNLASLPGNWPFPLDVCTMPMPPFSPFRKS